MKLTGAQILIETLCSLGVGTVFGYPGGAVLDIYDQLYQNSHRIRHVLAAHEQGAAHAADGYARVSGRCGVVIATSGPGATNLVTGIANAYLDSVPMLAITGNVPVPLLGRDSFQEVDIVGITQPIVKHSYIVHDVNELERTLREAHRIAISGRKGPVLVDIPKSVQQQMAEYAGVAPPAPKKSTPLPDLAAALAAISAAKRPFIYAGGGVIAAGAEDTLSQLAERLSAAVGLSMMGLSALPHDHPANLGMCGMHGGYASNMAQAGCDLMIAAGVRFSDRATGDISRYTRNCTTIHIDIDAAEMGKNVRPDIALPGDVGDILAALLSQVTAKSCPEWQAEIAALRSFLPSPCTEEFSPRNIIRHVAAAVPSDTVVTTDVGQHQMWVAQNYPLSKPRTLLTSGGLGTMGFGLGAAVGGCIANGERKTIHFTSDGSFGMNLNELAAVVTEGLPVVTVILNNGVLGMVRQWQGMFYERRYSNTNLTRQTDFVKLAQAFGAEGNRVSTLAELDAVLAGVNGPTVIDCTIDPNARVMPMIPPGKSVEELIVE